MVSKSSRRIQTSSLRSRDWSRANQDIINGVRQYELWFAMGVQDIKRRYRRSVLGPLWITLSLTVLVAALSFLYGKIMGVPINQYTPHVALGLIAWQFIQGVVSEGCNVFVTNKEWITNIRNPLSVFVFWLVWVQLITMAHNALVYIGIAILFGIYANAASLLVIPALALLIVNAVWVVLLFGTLCARFRDIPQIVQSLIRIAFFVTPVMWLPDQLGERSYLALFNPFTYFVELIRVPLMGQIPSILTWGLALGVTISGWAVTWIVFIRFRTRIPYWL